MLVLPVIKKVVTVALIGVVAASLVAVALHYRGNAKEAQERLQEVTNELTAANDRYESFVYEQTLIRDVLALGALRKEQAKVSTNEAIKVHRDSGTRVTVSQSDANLLFQRSREVREAAIGAKH